MIQETHAAQLDGGGQPLQQAETLFLFGKKFSGRHRGLRVCTILPLTMVSRHQSKRDFRRKVRATAGMLGVHNIVLGKPLP